MTWLAIPSPPRKLAAWLLIAAFGCLAIGAPARGETAAIGRSNPDPAGNAFQVTIEVLELDPNSGQETRLDLHLVLFQDGKFYDFALTAPRDVTIVDPAAGKITLLSREQHLKTTLPTQDLVRTAARVRLFAKNEGIEDRLGINAKVVRQEDRFQIAYSGFEYDVTTAGPQFPLQPAQFAEFTDWVARVNLIRKLGTPPFARMELGHRIATAGRLPETITLTLGSEGSERTLRSRYRFENELSDAAAKRIEELAGMTTLYREVALGAFPK